MRKARRKYEKVTVGHVTVKIYEHSRRTSAGKPRTDFLVPDYTTGARGRAGEVDGLSGAHGVLSNPSGAFSGAKDFFGAPGDGHSFVTPVRLSFRGRSS